MNRIKCRQWFGDLHDQVFSPCLICGRALTAHAGNLVDAQTPGPIPRGDQAGRTSAPGEGARSDV